MNPHARLPASPLYMLQTLWRNRRLIVQMSRREVVGRYRGSILGLTWSFFNPLLMLLVYTFVFGVVFKARWGADGEQSKSQFALLLFTGMIVHGLVAESLMRAPELIVGQVNYVKKVIFPLETLAVVAAVSAIFHTLVSCVALVAAMALIRDSVPLSAPLFVVVLLPLAIGTVGLAWIISSLGVFVRDISQTIGLLMTVLLFVSPVFFPLSALPPDFRVWVALNPLTFFMEQARNVVIWGTPLDWPGLGLRMLIACVLAWFGYWWFQRTRKGFGDVL